MIQKIFDYAKNKNIKKITVFTYETNPNAINFFSRVGFRKTEVKDDRVYFEKLF